MLGGGGGPLRGECRDSTISFLPERARPEGPDWNRGGGRPAPTPQVLATFPLMTINTRQQTRGAIAGARRGKADTVQELRKVRSPHPVTRQEEEEEARRLTRPLPLQPTRQKVLEKDGVAGLYTGITPAVVGTIASNLVYFYLCGYLKEARLQAKARRGARRGRAGPATLSIAESLALASVAGCGNVLLTNPIWIIVTRSQAQTRRQLAESTGQAAKPEPVLKIIHEVRPSPPPGPRTRPCPAGARPAGCVRGADGRVGRRCTGTLGSGDSGRAWCPR